MLNVILLAHTPMPEKIVAAGAKMCYSSSGPERILDGLSEEKAQDFLSMLTDLGHESPFEHASFTFGVEGVSRSLLAQLTRHRIASFSAKSQRYVKEDHFTFVTPPEIEKDEGAKQIYLASMQAAQEAYEQIAQKLFETHLKTLTAAGEPEKSAKSKAQKMAIEDARFVLPNACETKLVMTMNARSLFHFFELRCCYRAQWEIRELAWRMLFLCRDVAPALFQKAGPSCLYGPCREGSMSCGKMDQVKKRSQGNA